MVEPKGRVGILSPVFRVYDWLLKDVLSILTEIRLSYIPPLMVYFAAGVSGFTGIIESFFVKEELGLTPAFLAGLGFWTGLPWVLKMPIGHLVDLYWRRKYLFVYLGASLMTLSLMIMIGLTGYKEVMERYIELETWYIVATLLSPIGFVLQDVVADAMTVEAVPETDDQGNQLPEITLKRMHITMQTLGRIAIIGGSALVAGLGGWLAQSISYKIMYKFALIIPVISVLGVILSQINLQYEKYRLHRTEKSKEKAVNGHSGEPSKLTPDWKLLGGCAAFVLISLLLGLSDLSLKKEMIFLGSLAVVLYLMHLLLKDLTPAKRREIISIAAMIFIFRSMPGFGAGASWWQIDVLGFDESFMGTLRQISAILAIMGLFALRGWMNRRPIPYLVVFLSVYNAVMMSPFIGMYYGLHEWTETHFGFGARTIAIIDTMADSPLGQVMMVPMLAWIAREAPDHQKASFFAVMAAFTNLALSASSLLTKYVNRTFVIERGDYSSLGYLLIAVTMAMLIVPILSVLIIKFWNKGAAADKNND